MKARVVHTKIWQDSFFGDLTVAEKLVFLYLLTTERVNIIHCFECTDRTIMFETGVNREQLDNVKRKLSEANKVRFFKGWVHLVNADRYQHFNGDKNEQAKKVLEREMSPEVFAWYKGKCDTPIDTGIDTPSIPSVSSNQYSVTSKKGGVGENNAHKSADFLVNLPDEVANQVGAQFNLRPDSIRFKAESLYDWYQSNPRKNRRENWLAVLRNAVRSDADALRKREQGSSLPYRDISHIEEEE